MTSTSDAIAAVTAALAQLPPADSIPEEKQFKLVEVMDKVENSLTSPCLLLFDEKLEDGAVCIAGTYLEAMY
ncbi:S-adenosyl-L-methionine-dependent methyltransferase [Penicillium pulvis]|uniref:S-adenosyl-L-methionine-dependent methyltransferase n=1 Tax=Penicillium pulvis TaxID=1562058 RepID=UPI002547F2DF|nr:S-adenosyl-L-methionine-dependent methyltransferase [Penicillium pulvis]KAJ5810349.1 S-adenosyl-L-methionine-dependent methyltransferase [Penicillium pulvis]